MSQSWNGIEDAIARTFRLKTCVESGTAFAIERGDRQYLVTAGHMVRDSVREVMQGETIRIRREGQSHEELARVSNIRIKTLDDQGRGVDVAVMETEDRIMVPDSILACQSRKRTS